MISLKLKALLVVPVCTLFVSTLLAQTTPTPAAPPSGGQNFQRPMEPQPTAQEVAIMDAALKYNLDPKSTLYQTHDPEIIKQGDTYYLFPTGCRVSSSKDLINWTFEYNVFETPQAWVTPDIVGANTRGSGALAGGGNGPTATAAPAAAPGPPRGGCGAPDVQLVNGTYYLFYNVTAFAKNTSAIGVATNKTLDPHSPDFQWVDHGMVVQSIPNRDMWNALDANLIMDRNQGWLVFGSFWGGIKMVKLAPDLLSVAKPEVWYALASQPRTFSLDDTDPGDGTIEGAFIYKHFQYFYLFASLDYCCRGMNSDYNVVVGRSRNVEGPYVDREGRLMSRGGGTLVAKGDANWAGVGHNSAYTLNGKSIIVMHGYDKRDGGRSKLIIREMKWDRGDWPSIVLSPELAPVPETAKPSAGSKAAR
jgi:arabinan endo-1,5-alpha-L-arabinosidase